MDTKAYVYILECKDNTYYTGYTTNVKHRLKMHNFWVGVQNIRGQEDLAGWYIVKSVILNLRQ